MRIVTRPDFDGVVCAVLIAEAEGIADPILWVSPNDMQHGRVDIQDQDIIANLPYHPRCRLWFDHHASNRTDTPFEGSFAIVPSAAGLVFRYYRKRLRRDYRDLSAAADKIDSADLNHDEIENPQNYPYLFLSMTLAPNDPHEEPYWNRVVNLLGRLEIDEVLEDPEVARRCTNFLDEVARYREMLLRYTRVEGEVAVTDFRALPTLPEGNRFLLYSLYPQTVVSVKIGYATPAHDKVVVKVGHSIVNRNCNVHVGHMLKNFDGGGHRGAGACRIPTADADGKIAEILKILRKNQP